MNTMIMMKRIALPFLLLLFALHWVSDPVISQDRNQSRQFFQLKIYHFDSAEQQRRTDRFLKNAFIPALHRANIDRIGVFKPSEQEDTTSVSRKTYVLIPFSSLQEFESLTGVLQDDTRYQQEGEEYLEASHKEPPFDHIRSILLKSFAEAPVLMTPELEVPKTKRVYELRSYESSTEALNRNKVAMFNNGEIDIFERLNFNPIFYGNVISGPRMPNLMYMTSFENMESRNTHWDQFTKDPHWKELSAMEKYQNNVSRADITLLHGTPYSDI